MSSVKQPPSPDAWWRSLEELADSPRFRALLATEFPEQADTHGLSRRRWLQLMGASLALAGVGGCRWKEQEILPFAKRPEDRTPGAFRRFATTMPRGEAALGIEVTTVDGRPIKIEGNPRHPASLGATDAAAQAAILELYDPDRSRSVLRRDNPKDPAQQPSGWDVFESACRGRIASLGAARGTGLCVLCEPTSSPTLLALRAEILQRLPKATWFTYEPAGDDHERAGSVLALGRPLRTHLALDAARVVLCLDADPLGSHPAAIRHARDFTAGRDPSGESMSRLYAVESGYSLTGAAADHRLPVRSGRIAGLVGWLERELAGQPAAGATAGLPSSAENTVGQANRGTPRSGRVGPMVAEPEEPARRFLQAAARDLAAHRGESLVCAGPAQAAEIHAAVHRINHRLGNVGRTLHYTQVPQPQRPGHVEAITALAEEIRAGRVQTLVILGGNPVYDAPADLGFGDLLARVPTSIHLGLYPNETARACSWHLPRSHFLESWGDLRAWDGTYSVVQSMIAPLGDTRSELDLVSWILEASIGKVGEKAPTKAQDLVRQTFQALGGDDAAWRRTLRDGLWAGSQWPAESVGPPGGPELPAERFASAPEENRSPLVPLAGRGVGGEGSDEPLEIVFSPSAAVHDGRWANSGWLQELPDPLSKLTWGNAALLAPATAERLGVQSETLLSITLGATAGLSSSAQNTVGPANRGTPRTIEIPAFILPGQAEGSIALALGYGRAAAGCVGGDLSRGVEPVGVDVYPLRTTQTMWIAPSATAAPTGRPAPLACTQDQHAIDTIGQTGLRRRLGSLVRQASWQEYRRAAKRTDAVAADRGGAPRTPLESENGHPERSEGPSTKSGEILRYAQNDKREDAAVPLQHAEARSPTPLWKEHEYTGHRWAMAIDLSRCTGCGACVVACQAENNVAVVGKEQVRRGRQMHWIRVDRYFQGEPASPEVAYQPLPCQQCELAPCEQVCPVAATTHSGEGLNDMVYNRCVGTRYCANNCPYKVRRFNFFNFHKDLDDPTAEVAKMKYNPQVTIRSRGVMEKCTYCVQRIQAAKIEAKTAGRPIRDGQIRTACQQVCPAGAITFGDLSDSASEVLRWHGSDRAYAILAELDTRPRTAYLARIRNPNPELI